MILAIVLFKFFPVKRKLIVLIGLPIIVGAYFININYYRNSHNASTDTVEAAKAIAKDSGSKPSKESAKDEEEVKNLVKSYRPTLNEAHNKEDFQIVQNILVEKSSIAAEAFDEWYDGQAWDPEKIIDFTIISVSYDDSENAYYVEANDVYEQPQYVGTKGGKAWFKVEKVNGKWLISDRDAQ